MKYYGFLAIAFFLGILLIPNADAREFHPFSFRLADEIEYNDIPFYVAEGTPNLVVDKGEYASFPIIILKKGNSTIIDFHATLGNQMEKNRFPPGVTINLDPIPMNLRMPNQTLYVTVYASDTAPSSKYNVGLVGVWEKDDGTNNFKGTAFSLHVGRDFGNDAIPVNFLLPPLKFEKEGVPASEIPCRNAMILILKHDDSPACVLEDTRIKLIQREWMKIQVDVFNDDAYIEAVKKLEPVQYFYSLHPNATVYVNERFEVVFQEEGFKEHLTSKVIHHTKELRIGLDYAGNPMPVGMGCGGPVSLDTFGLEGILKFLHDPDFCFPLDQTVYLPIEK